MTVTLGEGGTQTFTASVTGTTNTAVTWSVQEGAAGGTITSAGPEPSTLYTAPNAAGTFHIIASSAAKSATATVTVRQVSVQVSAPTASVPVNTMEPFTATVMFDVSNRGVTWDLMQSGTPCSPGCGTLSSTPSSATYTAPAAVPSSATVTLTAASIADPTQSATATITITSGNPNNAKLKGQYAFLLCGFDADGAVALAGSFTADGDGIISSGVEDLNRATGVSTSVVITGGTFTVFDDNRGQLLLTTSLGNSSFAFALGSFRSTGEATKLRVIEFDTFGTRVTGVAELQDPSAFSVGQVSGDFAFGGSGADFTGGRFGIAGRFSAGGGSITNGEFDANGRVGGNLGGASFNGGITGSYDVTTPNGRGTLQLTVPIPFVGTTFTLNFSFYVVSANELFFLSTDARSTTSEPLSSGQVLKQSPSPAAFSQASLKGISVLNDTGVGGAGGSDVEVGLLTTDGAGGFTSATDENNSGVIFAPSPFTGNYNVDPDGLGRVTLTGSGNLPLLYLVSQNQGFVLFTDDRVETGSFEPQAPAPTGGFTNASVSGAFFFGDIMPAIGGVSMNSGELSFDGVSALSGAQDSNQFTGLLSGQAVADTYMVSANGRTTTGSGSLVIYIVSDSKAVSLGVTAGEANAAVSIFEK